jgi:hypothetical protein
MATTINVTLNGLVELRERVDRRRLQGEDWVIVGALVSKLIARTEARQERLRAKANQQDAEQQSGSQDATKGAVGSTSQDRPTDESAKSTPAGAPQQAERGAADAEASAITGEAGHDEPRRKGHGRNGADAFTGAERVVHALAAGIIGSLCTACGLGPISRYRDKIIIRVIGQSIFGATRHHFEQGRCKLCGAIITASGTQLVLQGVGTGYITYAWSACAMLIVMHYFAGLPFKRLEALHEGWGVPMPDANQWRVVDESDDLLAPLYKALEKHGTKNATGLLIDDTGSMIILVRQTIRKELETLAALGQSTNDVRTGINATAIHLDTEEGKVILFFTGRHHAGEIIDMVLAHRKAEGNKLVAVTDAAQKNFDHDQADKLVQAVCNAHCYLKFRAVKDSFPAEYAVAAEVYNKVFDNDDEAKKLGLSPEQRMLYHRDKSMPQMQRLWQMCKEKVDSRLVEPNSSLWEPVSFVINQWPRLTKFCEVPGVALDTNIVEQTLIIPVRYLAASFAYRTQDGADVGDRHMSLIATANACGVEPVAYITHCLENHEDLAKRPEHYLPWAYRDRIQRPDADDTDQTRPSPAQRAARSIQHPLRPGTRRDDRQRRTDMNRPATHCSAP